MSTADKLIYIYFTLLFLCSINTFLVSFCSFEILIFVLWIFSKMSWIGSCFWFTFMMCIVLLERGCYCCAWFKLFIHGWLVWGGFKIVPFFSLLFIILSGLILVYLFFFCSHICRRSFSLETLLYDLAKHVLLFAVQIHQVFNIVCWLFRFHCNFDHGQYQFLQMDTSLLWCGLGTQNGVIFWRNFNVFEGCDWFLNFVESVVKHVILFTFLIKIFKN